MMCSSAPRRSVWKKCSAPDVPEGCVYHAASKRRRSVAFTEELRAETVSAIESVRELLECRTGTSCDPHATL